MAPEAMLPELRAGLWAAHPEAPVGRFSELSPEMSLSAINLRVPFACAGFMALPAPE